MSCSPECSCCCPCEDSCQKHDPCRSQSAPCRTRGKSYRNKCVPHCGVGKTECYCNAVCVVCDRKTRVNNPIYTEQIKSGYAGHVPLAQYYLGLSFPEAAILGVAEFECIRNRKKQCKTECESCCCNNCNNCNNCNSFHDCNNYSNRNNNSFSSSTKPPPPPKQDGCGQFNLNIKPRRYAGFSGWRHNCITAPKKEELAELSQQPRNREKGVDSYLCPCPVPCACPFPCCYPYYYPCCVAQIPGNRSEEKENLPSKDVANEPPDPASTSRKVPSQGPPSQAGCVPSETSFKSEKRPKKEIDSVSKVRSGSYRTSCNKEDDGDGGEEEEENNELQNVYAYPCPTSCCPNPMACCPYPCSFPAQCCPCPCPCPCSCPPGCMPQYCCKRPTMKNYEACPTPPPKPMMIYFTEKDKKPELCEPPTTCPPCCCYMPCPQPCCMVVGDHMNRSNNASGHIDIDSQAECPEEPIPPKRPRCKFECYDECNPFPPCYRAPGVICACPCIPDNPLQMILTRNPPNTLPVTCCSCCKVSEPLNAGLYPKLAANAIAQWSLMRQRTISFVPTFTKTCCLPIDPNTRVPAGCNCCLTP